jgi:hypothetical protein
MRLSTISNRESAHRNQTSRVAARDLILPTLGSTSLFPTLTTLLYRVSIFQVLRQPLLVLWSFVFRGESPWSETFRIVVHSPHSIVGQPVCRPL